MDLHCVIIDGFLFQENQFGTLNLLQNLQMKQRATNQIIKYLQLTVIDNVFVCDSCVLCFSRPDVEKLTDEMHSKCKFSVLPWKKNFRKFLFTFQQSSCLYYTCSTNILNFEIYRKYVRTYCLRHAMVQAVSYGLSTRRLNCRSWKVFVGQIWTWRHFLDVLQFSHTSHHQFSMIIYTRAETTAQQT